jgi:hypothetical protein
LLYVYGAGVEMIKIKIIVAVLLMGMISAAHAASENFNFDLSTDVGYSATGWIYGDFNSSTFTAPSYYEGQITRSVSSTADAGIVSGAISNLLIKRTDTSWQFLFNVVSGGHTTFYLWNLVSSGELTATASKALLNSPYNFTANENEVYVMYSNNTTRTTDTIYGSPSSFVVTAVPEMDGNKFPQALVLLIAVFVLARRWTSIGQLNLELKPSCA